MNENTWAVYEWGLQYYQNTDHSLSVFRQVSGNSSMVWFHSFLAGPPVSWTDFTCKEIQIYSKSLRNQKDWGKYLKIKGCFFLSFIPWLLWLLVLGKSSKFHRSHVQKTNKKITILSMFSLGNTQDSDFLLVFLEELRTPYISNNLFSRLSDLQVLSKFNYTLLGSVSEWPKDQALLLTIASYSKKYMKI